MFIAAVLDSAFLMFSPFNDGRIPTEVNKVLSSGETPPFETGHPKLGP